jgi:uncharacterized protein
MLDLLQQVATETWLVTAQMAPYLLFGFLVAGLLSVFLDADWLERHLGGRGVLPVFNASLFGVPLPLCSCGVIPVAASLRQHGASRAATTAFLLSTPQTGVDSIMITWTMLGPLFAIFRPVAALLTGVLGGLLVQLFGPGQERRKMIPAASAANPFATVEDIVQKPRLSLYEKARQALTYGLITLPADIGKALLVGLLVAGILAAVIPEDFLASYLGSGPLSIALMMIVGIPLYVCATASVPLAAGFIFLGATPGAALAFLIAGPATNAATITTISRVLGRSTAAIYLSTVAISAFGGGLLLDWLLPKAAAAVPLFAQGGHGHEGVKLFDHAAGVLLVIVMLYSWWALRQPEAGKSCCAGDDHDHG